MIKSPQKDLLTTNLESIKIMNREKVCQLLDKEVVYEPTLYYWLERLREKSNLNVKGELAFKTKIKSYILSEQRKKDHLRNKEFLS